MTNDPIFSHAITRRPGANFATGLTTATLGQPDYQHMLEQHLAYCETLRSLGLEVIELPPEPDFPDAHFVEDTAIVTPSIAIITRPGAPERLGEQESIAPVLSRFRPLAHIKAPGTVDGGDVLMVGDHFFIGLSARTNRTGAEQLGHILSIHGYSWDPVPVGAGLHLKSGVNWVGGQTLLLSPAFANCPEFRSFQQIVLDENETYAGNTLLINDHLLMPAGYPHTRQQLASLGLPVIELDTSESRKMDGGLTCLSLRF